MQNQRIPKKIAKGAMEGKRKRERPRKGWMGGVEEDSL
jgi:hypothetical protein